MQSRLQNFQIYKLFPLLDLSYYNLLKMKLLQLIKRISQDGSLLRQMIDKQKEYSDKLVYENIDKQIAKIINEEY